MRNLGEKGKIVLFLFTTFFERAGGNGVLGIGTVLEALNGCSIFNMQLGSECIGDR